MEQGVKVREDKGDCWPEAFKKADVGEKHYAEGTEALDIGFCVHSWFWWTFWCVHVHRGTNCVGALEVARCVHILNVYELYFYVLARHQADLVIKTIILSHRLTHMFVKVQLFIFSCLQKKHSKQIYSPTSLCYNTVRLHSTTDGLNLPWWLRNSIWLHFIHKKSPNESNTSSSQAMKQQCARSGFVLEMCQA